MHITKATKMISLRFSFSNPDHVPVTVREIGAKKRNHPDAVAGKQVMKETPDCSILPALEFLDCEFELIDATHEIRFNKGRPYQVVTFNFARNGMSAINAKMKQMIGAVRIDLDEMLKQAMWHVCAFENPFYREGLAIEGMSAISINMSKRQPLFLPDGKPVVQRQKDANGRIISEVPTPIAPKIFLELTGEAEERLSA